MKEGWTNSSNVRANYGATRAAPRRFAGSWCARIAWTASSSAVNIPSAPYFADVACVAKKLMIEIDGEHHADRVEEDRRRTEMMERLGWRVVRFSATEIVQNPEGIWSTISIALRDRK